MEPLAYGALTNAVLSVSNFISGMKSSGWSEPERYEQEQVIRNRHLLLKPHTGTCDWGTYLWAYSAASLAETKPNSFKGRGIIVLLCEAIVFTKRVFERESDVGF